jgi:hypothetical protein
MKYLLLIRPDESFDGEPPVEVKATTDAWVREMDSRGVRLHGARIRPAQEATGVRVSGGQVVITDGPYAESKEQMGGYDVIECQNLDEAIEVASKHPVAGFGTVEIRAFWDQ